MHPVVLATVRAVHLGVMALVLAAAWALRQELAKGVQVVVQVDVRIPVVAHIVVEHVLVPAEALARLIVLQHALAPVEVLARPIVLAVLVFVLEHAPVLAVLDVRADVMVVLVVVDAPIAVEVAVPAAVKGIVRIPVAVVLGV